MPIYSRHCLPSVNYYLDEDRDHSAFGRSYIDFYVADV